jgi:ribosomal protein S16
MRKNFKNLIIRLKQKGHSKYRLFDIVLVFQKSSKFGYIIERIGFYNPNLTERFLVYDSQRIGYWVKQGALVHFNVKKLISKSLI